MQWARLSCFMLACLLLMAGTAAAQRVADVDMIVYENDTVVLYGMKVYEGKLRSFLESNRTDYLLKMTDDDDRTTDEVRLPVLFYVMTNPPQPTDAVPVSATLVYNDRWKTLQVYHNGSLIFQENIEDYFCDDDRSCEPPNENAVSCPVDCPPGGADGWCQPDPDGACDPDCLAGLDPDCGQSGWLWAVAGAVSVIIVIGLVWYLRRA